MGWEKGRLRGWWKDPPHYLLLIPGQGGELAGIPRMTRSEHLIERECAVCEFVESGEHIEAEKYHPGIKAKAEAAYEALVKRNQKLKTGSTRARQRATSGVEARRQWLAEHCYPQVFMRSRKAAIHEIQKILKSNRYVVPSEKRLYIDIAEIRAHWGFKYFSRAKDKQ